MSLDSSWIVIESSPGPITARVGRRNPALDRLLARHGATGCTYLPDIPQQLAGYVAVEILKRDTIYWHEVGKPTVQIPWTIPQFRIVPLRGPVPVTDPLEWK